MSGVGLQILSAIAAFALAGANPTAPFEFSRSPLEPYMAYLRGKAVKSDFAAPATFELEDLSGKKIVLPIVQLQPLLAGCADVGSAWPGQGRAYLQWEGRCAEHHVLVTVSGSDKVIDDIKVRSGKGPMMTVPAPTPPSPQRPR